MARAKRSLLLDLLRIICVAIYVVYHGIYDVKLVYGTDYSYLDGLGFVVLQKTVLCLFMVISGMSFAITCCEKINTRHYLRGLELLGVGTAITVCTYFFMPSELIQYGVITFFGLATLLSELFLPLLRHFNKYTGLVLNISLAIISKLWLSSLGYAANDLFAVFGYRSKSFVSSDYVPLLPYIFVFWCGYYLYDIMKNGILMSYQSPVWLAKINGYCLLIYIVHQPVLLLVLKPFC